MNMADSENGRKLRMRKAEKGLDVRTGVTSSSENGRKLRIRKAEKGLDVRTRVTSSRVQETARRGLNHVQGGGLEVPKGVDKIPYVNDAFRMRLAIQLVLNRHNQIRDSVLFNAYTTWKEFEETKKRLFGDD